MNKIVSFHHVVNLTYLLGVDRSVGIIESPDHIMCKPGARHDGTQP